MLMDTELLHKVALSMMPHVDAALARVMSESGVSPSAFFTLEPRELSSRLGLTLKFDSACRDEAMFKARRELDFMERHSVRALYLYDDDYPFLLREIPDAPVLLYVLGNTDLNAHPVLSLVGTRRCTPYGVGFCRSLVSDLAPYLPSAMVISGLAYGIDAAAHTAALDNGLVTVAVLAHGLDMIYPAAHRDLARRILSTGGALVSEYPVGTRPFQGRFLQRNRIVAGMSEVTFVAESEVKGGAMSTANQAFSYSREVVALPGRVSDVSSSGCNLLIARNKAHIFTSVPDVMELMGWKPEIMGHQVQVGSPRLFPELEGDSAKVFQCLQASGCPMSVDEIHVATSLSVPSLMASLTELEFDGIIVRLPGARYELA